VKVIKSNKAKVTQRKLTDNLLVSQKQTCRFYTSVFQKISTLDPLPESNKSPQQTHTKFYINFSYFALYARSFKVLRNKSFYTFLISQMHAACFVHIILVYLLQILRQENGIDSNGKWDERVSWIQMALSMTRWSILWKCKDISFIIKMCKFLSPAEWLCACQHAAFTLRFADVKRRIELSTRANHVYKNKNSWI
jgi:hypothetical protein